MAKSKKWIAVIGVILLLLLFRGGGWISSRLNMLNSRENLDIRDTQHFEPIITSIADKDSSALFDLFSLNVQKSNPSLNDDIGKLFEFIPGDIEDWEVVALMSTDEIHRGKKEIQYRYAIQVSTPKNTYNIRIVEQTRNDFELSSIGLVSLEAYDKEDPDVIVRVPRQE